MMKQKSTMFLLLAISITLLATVFAFEGTATERDPALKGEPITPTDVGALVLTILVNFMNIMNVNPFIQRVIIGSIFICFVVVLDRIRTLRLMKQYAHTSRT